MPSTNILLWNPTLANQETDSAYAADANRSGGFATDAIWPSALANKTLFQVTAMLVALANIMVAQGYNANDNDPSLTADMTAALQALASGGAAPAVIVVGFSATPTFTCTTKPIINFQMTLTGNVSSATLAGVLAGQIINFIIKQDATGGRTFVPPGSVPLGTIDPTANATSVQSFVVDSGGTLHPLGGMTSS
jgi:hypothetical protein